MWVADLNTIMEEDKIKKVFVIDLGDMDDDIIAEHIAKAADKYLDNILKGETITLKVVPPPKTQAEFGDEYDKDDVSISKTKKVADLLT